ncbi:MAG: formylglycine-generating enzyme family protein [Chitinophagaceae bacterium]|nr:MAG: formylglycine-generating enzyme family protein [Chitinophagaceae bacterium]
MLAGFCAFHILSAQVKPTSFKPYEQNIKGTAVKFKLVPIPAGSFTMGSPASEKGRKADEGPQQKVTVDAFWMGIHEVTHDEFLVFFDDDNTSRNDDVDAVTRPTAQYIDLSWGMGKQGGFPANSMSQHTAMMYCHWLYQKTGVFYRLPTEAEWEYACRAGSKTAWYYGNDPKLIDQYAWHSGNSKNKYQKVGQKKPNAWGLYDMMGNVSEWTLDQYIPNYFTTIAKKTINPRIPPANKYPKSVRGGGYTEEPLEMRSANRLKSNPEWNKRDPQIPKSKWWLTDGMSVGFRVVSPLKQPTKAEAEAFYKQYISL